MKTSIGILALAALLPAVAWGQSASLAPGARVRVTSPSDNLKRHVSTVTEVRGDSIVMSGSSGSRTVAVRNFTALDVSTGTRNRVLRDGLIGFGAGALIGAGLGLASHDDCSDQYICLVPASRGETAALGAAVFGAAGLVAGAIIGTFHRTDRWERRELPVRVAIEPSRSGGVAFSISRTF